MKKQVFGLIGRRLGHSFSVPIHRELGNPDYRLYELEPEGLAAFFRDHEILGINVTIPYKQSVIPYLASLSDRARAIGSVNTIVPAPEGLRGHNTDAPGFAFMAARGGISLAGKKVLVFGSGGASLTVRYMAEEAGARSIAVISRSGPDNYENLSRHEDAEILVNTTPVGMFPGAGRAVVDLARFPRCEGVLDLIYNPMRTALLLQAETLGIPRADGLPMMVAQARAAEELFLNREIPASETERVLGLLRAGKTNIVLIGMPGAGKTTVGAALAGLTGRELVDLDGLIERTAGKSIPEIFRESGEAAFRELEREQAARAGARNGIILVCGGGVVLREENYASLRQNGRIYHLVRGVPLLAREGRPLSAAGDLESMYRDRLPLYTRFRDAAVENDGTPVEAAQRIWRDFCEHPGD